jgi:hypothetical protein
MQQLCYYILRAIWLLLLSVSILCIGCTKEFENINKNPYDFTEEELKADYELLGEPLAQAMLNFLIANDPPTAQLQQNLNADIYSGYMMTPTPFEGNINNTNYGLLLPWNVKPWLVSYGNVMSNCDFVQIKARDKYPDFYAWAQIIKVEAMHRVSDIYGPIIYTKYGMINPDHSIDFDSQQVAYFAFFKDLDEAIKTLTAYVEAGNKQRFTVFDMVYKGDYRKWIRFANTLRLRLAIRISHVDKEKAKIEGEAALSHPLGLLTTADDNFNVNIEPVTHPLNIMCYTWSDIRMGAPMESILTGYNDPRLPHYFVPSNATTHTYSGIRNGIDIPSKDRYTDFSKLVKFENKILFMTAAEAWFLKAEAALYGWAGSGDAKSNYEKGIATSFTQYGLSNYFNAYVNNNTSKPRPYEDSKNPINNVPVGDSNLSTITIKWDDAASLQQKTERIITQKWIAMYPEGQEAWAEFRRTGYPKLFPVVINNSGGTISTTGFIRRINLPYIEYTTNPIGVEKALKTLKGPDNGGTRLWWDL